MTTMTTPESKAPQKKLSELQWRKHCSDWEQSNDSQAIYCERHGLNYSQFVTWRSVVLKEQGLTRGARPHKKKFTEVAAQPLAQQAMKVFLANGVTAIIPFKSDHSIQAILSALGGL